VILFVKQVRFFEYGLISTKDGELPEPRTSIIFACKDVFSLENTEFALPY
jgi:hypothetical protein